MVRTPVALFVFNRPEQTARTFAAIRKARPSRLLIVADGARADRPGEAALCRQVREIVSQVDWECMVERAFSEANLGCRGRLSSGLDWVFERCDEAIILEDDCLPDPSFFPFCEALLPRYRNDPRVMMISGDNFVPDAPEGAESYRFTAYAHVWGWASWARAWRSYDVTMADWPAVRASGKPIDFGDRFTEDFWRQTFDHTYSGAISTWDFQWMFACFRNGLSIVPNVNLVTNIGFGAGATHHEGVNHLAELPAGTMEFPLKHPGRIERNRDADRRTFDRVFMPRPSFRNRVAAKVRGLLARGEKR